MRLALSSAAAPGASLPDLLSACVRRGLSALELTGADAIRWEEELIRVAATDRDGARRSGVEICSIFLEAPDVTETEPAVRLAARLEVPLVIPAEPCVLSSLSGTGVELIVTHGADPEEVASLPHRLLAYGLHDARLAWEVRPGKDDPASYEATIRADGRLLRYVRLHGGGPEAELQTGTGVGALMASLAIARYRGSLVITPSSSRYLYAWREWLGRGRGWGCGSKRSDHFLVSRS
jgi:hypothetical protein